MYGGLNSASYQRKKEKDKKDKDKKAAKKIKKSSSCAKTGDKCYNEHFCHKEKEKNEVLANNNKLLAAVSKERKKSCSRERKKSTASTILENPDKSYESSAKNKTSPKIRRLSISNQTKNNHSGSSLHSRRRSSMGVRPNFTPIITSARNDGHVKTKLTRKNSSIALSLNRNSSTLLTSGNQSRRGSFRFEGRNSNTCMNPLQPMLIMSPKHNVNVFNARDRFINIAEKLKQLDRM